MSDLFSQPPPVKRTRRVRKATDTQRGAFLAVQAQEEHGTGLGTRQQAVYDVIQRYPRGISNSEIAAQLDLPINRITPRTLELRQKGYVIEGERRACTVTGSWVQTWRAK